MEPVVIAVAITGSVPRKKDNPALPTTPPEQVESTHQAFEAGATLVHIHVRNPDESSSSDPALFGQVQEGVRRLGAVAQARHGLAVDRLGRLPDDRLREPHRAGRGPREQDEGERGAPRDRDLRPVAHPRRAPADRQGADGRASVQFVMGVQNALPGDERLLDILLEEGSGVLPQATWTAAGIGPNQARVMEWVLARGGDGVRTGLED